MTTDPARHVIELKAGGPDDPDGVRTAMVLSAYFHAEHMRAFRRLLWPRLGVLAVAWAVIGGWSSLLSARAILAGVMLFGAIAIGAAIVEWRASQKLSEVLGLHESIVHSRPAALPRV